MDNFILIGLTHTLHFLGVLGGLVNQSDLGGFPHEELVFVEDVPEALPAGRYDKSRFLAIFA
jgi:hypothetical protein